MKQLRERPELLTVFLLFVVTAFALYCLRVGNLSYLTLWGACVYSRECERYEDLLNTAAYSPYDEMRREAIVELNRTVRPTVAAFAAKHPQYVRSGVKVGELERREAALPPPPPQVSVAPVVQP